MFVVPIRAEDIEDHYRLYGMAQGLAAAGAVRRITPPVLARLDELVASMADGGNPDLMHDLNWEFHSLVNRTGASSRTLSVLRLLSHALPREVYSLPDPASPEANSGARPYRRGPARGRRGGGGRGQPGAHATRGRPGGRRAETRGHPERLTHSGTVPL